MRAHVPPSPAVLKRPSPAVALRPLDAEPMPPPGPKAPVHGGGMMGGLGGGISPGSLGGVSRTRLCMYILGAMAVLFLLFIVYVYAMFDDSGEPRAPPGMDNPQGLGGNGDR
ncbi:hypothetical protein MTO96_017726 [Rhipicephalus appendiculatus]